MLLQNFRLLPSFRHSPQSYLARTSKTLVLYSSCVLAAEQLPAIQHLNLCRHHLCSKVTGCKITAAATQSNYTTKSKFQKRVQRQQMGSAVSTEGLKTWLSVSKTVKVVLPMDIQKKKGKNLFVRQRKLFGDYFPPSCQHRRFPQGSLFHNQEVEEGFWVNCSDTQCDINPL